MTTRHSFDRLEKTLDTEDPAFAEQFVKWCQRSSVAVCFWVVVSK
jgi:hypothetical protein